MSSRGWLQLAAGTAAILILAVAIVGIPGFLWNSPAVVGVILLAILAGLIFLPPTGARGAGGSNAAAIASIGPMGFAFVLLVPWTALSVAVALHQMERLAWLMLCIAIGGGAISFFVLRAATTVIANVASAGRQNTSVSQLASDLDVLALAMKDASLSGRLRGISSDLQLGPSQLRNWTESKKGRVAEATVQLRRAVEGGVATSQTAAVEKLEEALRVSDA